MSYAIISVGGKQYRVQEGERLLVDRLREDEGKTFTPQILLSGGDGDAHLAPDGIAVTARVVKHVRGEKIRIGKYKRRTGYRRHTGFRSSLTQIEIEAIGKKKAAAAKPKAQAAPAATEEKPKRAAKPKAETTAKPKAAAKPKGESAAKKPPARKPATRKKTDGT